MWVWAAHGAGGHVGAGGALLRKGDGEWIVDGDPT